MSAELRQLLALLEARVNGEASPEAGEDEAGDLPSAGRYFADAIMQPGKLAAAGLAAIHAHQYSVDPATGRQCQGVSFGALTAALDDLMGKMLAPSAGTEVIESHLLASGVLLGNAATAWLTYSLKADDTDKAEVFGRLALRAQEQQRKTLKTLADIRSPKRATFIKRQVNQAINQQVNNGDNGLDDKSLVESQAENFSDRNPHELLEVLPSERLDTRTQGPASGVDPQLEALGAIHRPQD